MFAIIRSLNVRIFVKIGTVKLRTSDIPRTSDKTGKKVQKIVKNRNTHFRNILKTVLEWQKAVVFDFKIKLYINLFFNAII